MNRQPHSSGAFPIRILIVDDHPNTATTLARAVSQLGDKVDVFFATSGREALERVKEGAADILITDMIMPEMNGLELVEKLQNHPGGRPSYIILITAYDVPGLKETARRVKVDEIIVKPVRPERICQIVGRLLDEWNLNKPPETEAKAKGNKFKILVADDRPDNVTLLTRYLQNEGYDYITAADGVETLERVRDHMPDLLLLDINMPKKDGFVVLEEIRADPAIQHIPVIILTAARLDPADVQSGFNLGADDYVMKPFDRRELMARIRTKLRVKQAEDVIRRRNRELNLLPEIGKDLSARLDIEELSTILLKRTVETLGAFMGYLVILNKNGPFQKTYHLSNTQLKEEIPLPQNLFSIVNDSQQGFIIDDARTDARWQGMPSEVIRSAVVVPLYGRHEMLGMLILAHEHDHYFNLDHMLLLQAICSQAAIAVENANLFAGISHEQKRLQALLRSAADAILMFDASDSLTLINPAGERLFTDFETKLGLPLAHGKGYDALIALLDQTYQAGSPQTGEVAWPDQRIFATLVTPIEDGGHVVTLHDISHFKELERMKNEFIATASHDLKNPIATISGFSHLMAQAGPLTEMQVEFVDRIQSASQNMNELVQSLLQLVQLDLSAGFQKKHDPVKIEDLVLKVVDEYEPQATAKEQSITVEKTATGPIVQGDASQLAQVLRNLVGNAIKYTPHGGRIAITAQVKKENILVDVQDTGFGIPAADLPFIFNRFYRVRSGKASEVEGNGLGLAIVKSITEQHGGQISVESEVNKGTRFSVSLPLLASAEFAMPKPAHISNTNHQD
jgi:signal transduction histidine kinase/DNA-binding response OmpR family regulator